MNPPAPISSHGESTAVQPAGIPRDALVEWLRGKVAVAEKTLKAREDMARTWRSGSDAEWSSAAAMHPSTAGRAMKKPARLREAASHDRIAVKLRHELEMFRAALASITSAKD